MTKKPLYDTLHIDPTAPKEKVRKASRRRMAETHPDRTAGDDAQFKQVAKYDVDKLSTQAGVWGNGLWTKPSTTSGNR